jgi:hypothetical protein
LAQSREAARAVASRGPFFCVWGCVARTLKAITKKSNRYIRKQLVLGATSLLNVVGKRQGTLRDWIVALVACPSPDNSTEGGVI